jgi:hypothetical protein
MYNDPEWATKEEWDTYAWFGFAMQEAQSIEFMFLIMAVALDTQNYKLHPDEKLWDSLYDNFGRWTLGRLYKHLIENKISLPGDFEKVVGLRNELAHGFFWPKNSGPKDKTTIEAQKELKAAASLFSQFSPMVESVMMSLIDNLSLNRRDAEAMVKDLLKNNLEENG